MRYLPLRVHMAYFKRNIGKLIVHAERVRTKYIKHRNFLIFISFIVGIISALAAVILKISVQFAEHNVERLNEALDSNLISSFFPLVGIGISLLLLNRIFKGRLKRGVGFILESIFTRNGTIPRKHLFGHLLTSAATVSMGGSVGLEAPIVSTGAAIGSRTAHDLRLSSKDTILLLACGTASGIAAIFNSPIAGIIFALEVLMVDFKTPMFIPLLISTATATVLSQILYTDKFFFFAVQGWDIKAIPFYILLGAICGIASAYTSFVVEKTEHTYSKYKPGWKTWLLAGIPLCLLILVLPGLYGEGYVLVTNLLRGNTAILTGHSFLTNNSTPYATVLMCLLLIAFKPFSAALTVAAGGNGGVFAPALIIGGLVGFLVAYLLNMSGLVELHTANFIITAMAGVLAGVMHAPLTAIFLLAEITGGYTLFIPLMIVCAISYFMTRKYARFSIYHRSLASKNILDADDAYDQL